MSELLATPDDPVFALFRGPALVLEAVSSGWSSRNFAEPPIGMPCAEAWPDEAWAPLQARMREAYRSGMPCNVDCGVLGVFTVIPDEIPGLGRVVGLAQTRRAPTPASSLPAEGLADRR